MDANTPIPKATQPDDISNPILQNEDTAVANTLLSLSAAAKTPRQQPAKGGVDNGPPSTGGFKLAALAPPTITITVPQGTLNLECFHFVGIGVVITNIGSNCASTGYLHTDDVIVSLNRCKINRVNDVKYNEGAGVNVFEVRRGTNVGQSTDASPDDKDNNSKYTKADVEHDNWLLVPAPKKYDSNTKGYEVGFRSGAPKHGDVMHNDIIFAINGCEISKLLNCSWKDGHLPRELLWKVMKQMQLPFKITYLRPIETESQEDELTTPIPMSNLKMPPKQSKKDSDMTAESSSDEEEGGVEVVDAEKAASKKRKSSPSRDDDMDGVDKSPLKSPQKKARRATSSKSSARPSSVTGRAGPRTRTRSATTSEDGWQFETPSAQKKSAREKRMDVREKKRGNSTQPAENTSSGGKRFIKVTNHGTHSNDKDYPRTGLYVILFAKMLVLGKSVTVDAPTSTGLSGRIKAAHGKGGSREVGEVTTITGGIAINYHDLELFFCFFLRSLLPKDEDGEYDRDKISSTEMFDLLSKQEGVNILAKMEKICNELNSGNDIFDRCYGDSSGAKICFRKSNATSSVTHFKEDPDYKKWMLVRSGKTEANVAQMRGKLSAVDPGKKVMCIDQML